ncbi:hypothetical protein ACHHYP_03266 [Achlya hypogyna]|uniref:Uncharacterized protein n=1 Tax=Achlya hypogyna TaxID=1202772 RepID=A0A1V9ZRG8_ACHHY|nr:hypothetical protein ACHHYP_03266 [Achlya hypogyna]
MEAERRPLNWRPYVVLLLSGNSKDEKGFLERLQVVLSGALTPRERGVFKVVTRADLGAFKDNTPPEALAGAFHALVEKDRAEYMLVNAAKFAPKPKLPIEREVTRLASSRMDSARGSARGLMMNSNNAPPVEPLAMPPMDGVDDDMLSAAQAALEHDARDGSPSHIYVLFDYPASVAEVKGLITHKMTNAEGPKGVALSALVDSVVSIVFPPARSGRRPSASAPIEDVKPVVPEPKVPEPTPAKHPAKGGKPKPPAVAASPEPDVVAAPPPVVEAPAEPPGESKLHKELVAAADVGGVEWTDFSFTTLQCASEAGEPRTLATLTKELKQTLTDLAVDKCKFKAWLSHVTVVDVPTEPPGRALDHLLRSYNEILDPVFEPSVGIAGVLYAMKEAIYRASSKDRRVAPPPTKTSLVLPQFIDHGDVARVGLCKALHLHLSKHESLRSGEPRLLLGKSLDEIEKEMWLLNDLPGVGFQGRKGMPMLPTLSLVERGVLDTELMQFHGLDTADVHYTRKLLDFEALLGPKWEGKLRFRTFLEHLPKHVLPQRLAALLGQNVVLLKHYYAPDDSLLVAGHTATPQGRMCSTKWAAADWVRHRPPFAAWHAESLLPRAYLTPRTVTALGACVALSHGELARVAEVTHAFFPSDHAVVYVVESPHAPTWLTVRKDWHVFGLRPSRDGFPMNFHASFEDGSHVTISRGYGRTILVTLTQTSGLVVTVSSDGSIQQEYANRTGHASTPNQHEARRVVLGKGTVISSRVNGSQVIMYANGHVGRRTSQAEPFWTVDEGGSPYSVTAAAASPPPPVAITLEVDPETKAVIAHRADGVVTVTHVDGSYLTQHADGTQILGNGANSHLIVRKEGYAEVSIDVDVNLTAQRHAKGMKVAVTKGGIRTRSVLRLYDGTTLEVDYDTRVIASVHGILRLRKPDGTIVIAQDNGLVEFRPRSLATTEYPKAQRGAQSCLTRDDEEEPDASSGAYFFDCAAGSLHLSDHEHNHFALTIGDGKSPPVMKVDLAGVVSPGDCSKYGVAPIDAKAVVNDPLQPFLLILHGDGTGIEAWRRTRIWVLRPKDVEDYMQQLGRDRSIERVPCVSLGGATDPKLHVYTHALGAFEPAPVADAKERAAILASATIPARASALLLQQLHNTVPLRPPPVRLVRRLKEIVPFNSTQFDAMMGALAAWDAWVANREVTKDQYAVFDPRDEETRAQAHVMEKKIAAAYKATRARKKAERLKNREKERLAKLNVALEEATHEPSAAMSTLKEVENEEDEEEDADEDEGRYPGMHSDDSDADSRDDLDINVDDEYELLLCAFSTADTESVGRLNAVQTRRALVHALGFGVAQADVNTAIEAYSEGYDDTVTFEVFARILTVMKENHEDDATSVLLRKNSPRPKHP